MGDLVKDQKAQYRNNQKQTRLYNACLASSCTGLFGPLPNRP